MLDGPGAPLGDEGTVVLQELTPGSAAARVLELVALGAVSFTDIRNRAGTAPATTSEALSSLERLGLLDRLTPAGEDPRRTKKVLGTRSGIPSSACGWGWSYRTGTASSWDVDRRYSGGRRTGSRRPRRLLYAAWSPTGWRARQVRRAVSGGVVRARTSSTSWQWTGPTYFGPRVATGLPASRARSGVTVCERRCRRGPRSSTWSPGPAPGSSPPRICTTARADTAVCRRWLVPFECDPVLHTLTIVAIVHTSTIDVSCTH